MRKACVVFIFATLVIPVSVVRAASSKVSSASSKVRVTPAASAAEQLAQASQLRLQILRTPPSQKIDLFAQAWANLTLVRKVWPNDKSACVRSAVMQADLAAEFGVLPQAIDALLDISPSAAKTEMEPQVERRLGQAYEQIGNVPDAERHFLAAEKAMHSTHQNRVESQAILSAIAMFYSRQNKPQEAIRRFRDAQNLPGQDLVNQVHFQLSIAEEASRLGKDAAAPELARFDDLVYATRRTTLSPADSTLITHMTQHAQRIRDKAKR